MAVEMLIVDRSIVFLHRKKRSKWWTIECMGCSRHRRRKDGSCKHERLVLDAARPDVRPRMRIKREAQ